MKQKLALSLSCAALLALLTACSATAPAEPAVHEDATASASASEEPSAPPASEPVETYPVKPATTDLGCAEAVNAAAAVPGAETNNDEVYVSLIACPTFDEWFTAVRAAPGVFAVTSVAETDDELYAMVVCFGAEETPVCVDAAARGLV